MKKFILTLSASALLLMQGCTVNNVEDTLANCKASMTIPVCSQAVKESTNPLYKKALGYAYYKAENYTKAAKWFEKAAEEGNFEAQAFLGGLYERGEGVEQSNTNAAKWYRKAAEQGHIISQINLGSMYVEGSGVKKSSKEAFKWYFKAAQRGNPIAQFFIGSMYSKGEGVKKSYTNAVTWYRKSAEQNFAPAQTNLGKLYLIPNTNKFSTEAAKWLYKAAVQGDTQAQFILGTLYFEGKGVHKSLNRAVTLWIAAAKAGDVDAKTLLRSLREKGII